MALPVEPPLKPMLARLARELPAGELVFEPKWDGFRCLCFRDSERVDLRSRHDRPLARYFPEVVAALAALERERYVLDGELLVAAGGGFDFTALLERLHPAASRVAALSVESPATLIAFDLLALGEHDLTGRPFAERRELLLGLLGGDGKRLAPSPATSDRVRAERWLDLPAESGIDGVVAKQPGAPYRAGARELVKVKRERTADCVVGGLRLFEDGTGPSSLLLGLYDERGRLEHVGIASSFARPLREGLLAELRPLVVELEGHPWEQGFLIGGGATGRLRGAAGSWTPERPRDWIPVAPERVCEVAYEHVDGGRFRHPARYRRWRPDRDPRSCRFDQLGLGSP